MAVRALIFDCFGVLVSSARNKLKADFPELKDRIDDIGHQYDYGMISRRQFIESMAEVCGMTYDQMESLYLVANVRDEDAINWVKEFKKSGKYKIGMLSNVGPGLFDVYFDQAEQGEMFDEVVLSYQVGIAKPERATFELIANRLGVDATDCVMIDDTAVNIEAASNAGMKTVYFQSLDQAKADLAHLLRA